MLFRSVDKSSVILTILLAAIFLHEQISLPKGIGMVLLGAGTYLMIEKKAVAPGQQAAGSRWFFYAAGSAVFASLTAILGKVGIRGVESNLGTAIRTVVVLIMAWLMVFVTGKGRKVDAAGGFSPPTDSGTDPHNSGADSQTASFNAPSMWFDYIKMLERMSRDLHSPSLVAPKDLKHAHDEYVEKVNRQRVKEQDRKSVV